LTYSGVGDAEWESVKEAVGRAYGIHIDAPRGEASKRGFTLKWELDGETLRIQCSKKPFFVPCGKVNSRIQQLAAQCGVAAAGP
jgi:hypothetical protein